MKPIIITFIILSFLGSLMSYSSKTNTPTINTKVYADSIPDTLFYGLTAKQITTMQTEEIKAFCTKKGIPIKNFVLANVDAENYLLKKQAERDSIEVVRIYERIDKRLGIDK